MRWFFALVLLLQQSPPPEVVCGVDRDHISPGEEITYTVRVSSESSDPIKIVLPPLFGLEVIARSERTEVSYGGGHARITTLELRLRALSEGKWRLGPVQIRQGPHVVQGDPVEVTVEGNESSVAAALNPRIKRLLERAPPPADLTSAALTLVLSSTTARVGEQVDVVTTAWFPRDLRLQLRRLPTFEAPRIDGVWSYPQPTPSGIASSRLVHGRWYDLFVVHQIVFPLAPGGVRIVPAKVHFSVPIAFQFFSQEERYTLESAGAQLQVSALPTGGQPASFTGAIGHGLTLSRSLSASGGRVGEALTIDIVLRGEGNVALWPAPELRWPVGLRTYSDRTDERMELVNGKLTGAKTFRYLVVPDSSGSTILPSINYSFYDLAGPGYQTASVEGRPLMIAPNGEAGKARALPPPLLYARRPQLAWTVVHGLPLPLAIGMLLLPPAWFFGRRLGRRAGRRPTSEQGLDEVTALERELDGLLASLVPGRTHRPPALLARDLRLAGVEPALATEVAELRERLRSLRFGPPGTDNSPTSLQPARAVVARLSAGNAPARRSYRPAVIAGMLALLSVPGDSQTPPAEQLYEAGALRAAADGFARRAAREPQIPAHWYNLGAADFRMGESGRAVAAWTAALRLAPRNHHIRRALRLVPPPDPASGRQLWVAPVTAEELIVLAALSWLVGWVGFAAAARPRGRWVVLLAGSLGLCCAAALVRTWDARPVGVMSANTQLRMSPHERAPDLAPLGKETVVVIQQRRPGWLRVEDPDGRRGWIEQGTVAEIGRPADGRIDR